MSFLHLKERYTDGDGHLDEVLENAVETPASNGLVKTFVDRVLRPVTADEPLPATG